MESKFGDRQSTVIRHICTTATLSIDACLTSSWHLGVLMNVMHNMPVCDLCDADEVWSICVIMQCTVYVYVDSSSGSDLAQMTLAVLMLINLAS